MTTLNADAAPVAETPESETSAPTPVPEPDDETFLPDWALDAAEFIFHDTPLSIINEDIPIPTGTEQLEEVIEHAFDHEGAVERDQSERQGTREVVDFVAEGASNSLGNTWDGIQTIGDAVGDFMDWAQCWPPGPLGNPHCD